MTEYSKMSVSDLEDELIKKKESRGVDQSYGIQNAMGDAQIGALEAELERRKKPKK